MQIVIDTDLADVYLAQWPFGTDPVLHTDRLAGALADCLDRGAKLSRIAHLVQTAEELVALLDATVAALALVRRIAPHVDMRTAARDLMPTYQGALAGLRVQAVQLAGLATVIQTTPVDMLA